MSVEPGVEEPASFPVRKMGCIGAGYVGGTTMGVFAKYLPEVNIHVYDIFAEKIEQWNSDDLPIYEPGLDEIVKAHRGQNLFFTADVNDIADCDIIFISVNTPTKLHGLGAGKAANLQYLESSARMLKKVMLEHAAATGEPRTVVVVEKSTVPIRTAECLDTILSEEQETEGEGFQPKVTFHVLSNPEFMAEGTAIRDLIGPHRVLVGGSNQKAISTLTKLYLAWVPRDKILELSVWSSELSKLVSNTFLAQRVSSINAISALCEKTGADCSEVARAVGMDARIGSRFLNCSVGFGGSCFQKDILNLVYLAEHYGLPEVAEYFEGVLKLNDFQRRRFSNLIIHKLFSTVSNKKIAIFGFAFKQNTGDTRESSSIFISKHLLDERANLRIWDPKVPEKYVIGDLKQVMNGSYHYDPVFCVNTDLKNDIVTRHVEVIDNPYTAAEGCHAIVICTEWAEFVDYDYERLFNSMVKPAWVFDGRNILDPAMLRRIGFKVYTVGKPDID